MKYLLSLIVIVMLLLTAMVGISYAQDGANYVVQATNGYTVLYTNPGDAPKGEVNNGTVVTVTKQPEGEYVEISTPEGAIGYVLVADLLHLEPPAPQPQDTPVWQLPILPQDLPNALPAGVSNLQADTPACQSRQDMNEPCSTLEGQPVIGYFYVNETEQPELRLMNGDVILVRDASGTPLFPRIPAGVSGTNHDMVLLYTTEGVEAVQLHVQADWGSNRQDFYAAFPRTAFSESDVTGILAHQLRLALVESQPAEDACQPGVADCYPEFINPRNCASVEDELGEVVTYCDTVNIYVFRWNGQAWEAMMYGVYGLVRNPDGTASSAAYLDLKDRMAEFAAQ